MGVWRDESGLIVSWIVRLGLFFAALAVVLFDAGSIAVNFFTLDAIADDIATQISANTVTEDSFFNPQPLENEARELAQDNGARLIHFEVSRDGDISISLRRRASTLVVGRITAIEDWARATVDAEIRNTE
jgi:hypothetical protein